MLLSKVVMNKKMEEAYFPGCALFVREEVKLITFSTSRKRNDLLNINSTFFPTSRVSKQISVKDVVRWRVSPKWAKFVCKGDNSMCPLTAKQLNFPTFSAPKRPSIQGNSASSAFILRSSVCKDSWKTRLNCSSVGTNLRLHSMVILLGLAGNEAIFSTKKTLSTR